MTTWTPLPGHHPGQSREDVPYLETDYRGMACALYSPTPGDWRWSFYDARSYDPDLAVARGEHTTREEAEAELFDYIDGYVTR